MSPGEWYLERVAVPQLECLGDICQREGGDVRPQIEGPNYNFQQEDLNPSPVLFPASFFWIQLGILPPPRNINVHLLSLEVRLHHKETTKACLWLPGP